MTRVVCFDLDDTLVREVHSVMLPCILNSKLEQLQIIEQLEKDGRINWTDADYQKAALMNGLSIEKLWDGFLSIMKPLANILQTVNILKRNGFQSIVITTGPVQVAEIAKELWNLDAAYGSVYEVINGVFSGRIIDHIGDKGKISCLQKYCFMNGISPDDCIAVGDGSTDIPLFDYCLSSIAINASPSAIQKATYSICTDDLSDILRFIIQSPNPG